MRHLAERSEWRTMAVALGTFLLVEPQMGLYMQLVLRISRGEGQRVDPRRSPYPVLRKLHRNGQ